MSPSPDDTSPAWRVAFLASIVAVAAAFALLAYALVTGGDDGGDTETESGSGSPAEIPGVTSRDEDAPLLYSGPLPPALAAEDLQPAGAEEPDLVFTSTTGAGSGAVVRTFAPVTSYTSALSNVTLAEFQSLARGETSFATLGGYGGVPQFAVIAADQPLVSQMLPGVTSPVVFPDYAALRAAMADVTAGPFVGLAPLEELGPQMSALSLDGIDPLLATDLAAWPFVERVTIEAASDDGEDALPALQALLAQPAPPVTRLVLTGDILMSRCSLAQIRATGDWGSPFRGDVGAFLAAADLAFGSLDGSIQDIGESYGCVETTNLTSPPEVIEALTVAGFDEVTNASNHAADCGAGGCAPGQAVTRTVELVTAAGIKVVGAGATLDAALAPAIFEVNGISIGVLGFDDIAAEDMQATETVPGTAPLDDSYADEQASLPRQPAFYMPAEMLNLERFTSAITTLKQQVDIVVVQVQSGYEDTHDPSPRSVKALRAAVDAGADLVIGNQAHWAGAVEVRSGVFVAYALGNFIFDQLHTPEHSQGYLVEAILRGGQVASVRLHPYEIVAQHRPEFSGPEISLKILTDVYDASIRLAESPP